MAAKLSCLCNVQIKEGGLLIAKSINELFEKWSCFHFVDIYDWTDVVNDEGIDLSCELVARYK